MATQSKACCTLPAIVTKNYEEKGSYATIDGLKTYVTGPSTATHAIIFVYDIFGYFPQTLQGADILAHSDADRPYRVYMPDFFEGSPADPSWYPPQTDEHKAKLGEFFKTTAAPPKTCSKLASLVAQLKKDNPNITKWAGVGFCWGGKILSLSATADTPFVAIAECHPAMVDPADAEKITIPTAILASKDEDAKAVKAFEQNLKVPHHVETFGDQVHGWMTARGDLEDSKVKAEYERGYRTILEFFHTHV